MRLLHSFKGGCKAQESRPTLAMHAWSWGRGRGGLPEAKPTIPELKMNLLGLTQTYEIKEKATIFSFCWGAKDLSRQ